MAFHDEQFPIDVSFGSLGGPERRTDIVTLANGHEERNTPWAHSRRRYDAGIGLRSLDDLGRIVVFFEARRGPLHAFRWKDWRDGIVYGSTDHDGPLVFDGTTFSANHGMSARAFDQSTGLSVDNSEALGVLSDAGVRDPDILAGRFDGAVVEAWLVNWKAPSQRIMLFRGEMGEIERAGGAFKAELRGLTEALNQPQGQVYQSPCAAILGDGACQVDISGRRYSRKAEIAGIFGALVELAWSFQDLPNGWFDHGQLIVLTGVGAGATQIAKADRVGAERRSIELWDALPKEVASGDRVRLVAGCDKRIETCRGKFANVINLRGFPHLPGDDWLLAHPRVGTETE